MWVAMTEAESAGLEATAGIYYTGAVDQELLRGHAYLVTRNCLLCAQIKGRIRLSDGERKILVQRGGNTYLVFAESYNPFIF